MRWFVPRPAAEAQNGDKRTRAKFAWWPTLVDTDEESPSRVWLERYWVQESYQHVRVSDGYGYLMEYRWVEDGRWSVDPFIEEAFRQVLEGK